MTHPKTIQATLEFPRDLLEPFIETCFNQQSNIFFNYAKIASSLFPLYHQFKNATSGRIVIAKEDSWYIEPEMLLSVHSLWPYKELIRLSKDKFRYDFPIPYSTFRFMKSSYYHGYELMEFKKKKLTDKFLLSDMSNNSLSYLYWCMLKVSEGKKIGTIEYRNGLPDLDSEFHELEMKEFIPRYYDLVGL